MGLRYYELEMEWPNGGQTNGVHHAAVTDGYFAQSPNRAHATLANNTIVQLPDWDECREQWAQDFPTLPSPSIPPDVLATRYDNMNSNLCDFLRAPRNPDSPTEDPPHLKGIGIYSHVGMPAEEPRFPHQRFYTPPPEFLPVGGHGRMGQGLFIEQPIIPAPVEAVYARLNEVMEEEEQLDWTAFSPKTRFHALPLPEMNITPVARTRDAEDIDMSGMDQDTVMMDGSNEPRRHSVPGVVPQSWDSSRRTSVPGGGDARPHPVRGVTTSGTTYDESRDPRRRGR